MEIKLTAVFQKVPEGYIGFVEELPRGSGGSGVTSSGPVAQSYSQESYPICP